MAYSAKVLNIMIASPSDVSEERIMTRQMLWEWNYTNSQSKNIVLMPLGWEYNAYPSMMSTGQELINKHVLKNADLLVGIFWTRIGTPTGKAISGTVEEIEEHIKAGKDAMLYFCSKPAVQGSINEQQYSAVKNLRAHYHARGLTRDFEDLKDFQLVFLRDLLNRFNNGEKVEGRIAETATIPHELTPLAKNLLTEMAKDPHGQLMTVSFKGGFTFQASGKQLNEDYAPRTRASFEDALEQLIRGNLVESVGTKGQIFRITAKGFVLADQVDNEKVH